RLRRLWSGRDGAAACCGRAAGDGRRPCGAVDRVFCRLSMPCSTQSVTNEERPPTPRAAASLSFESGSDLLSQGVAPQVPSALAGLTSVFGMGTGGSPPLSPPDNSVSSRLPRELHSEHESMEFESKPSAYEYRSAKHIAVLTPPAYQPGLLPGALPSYLVGSLISRWASHLDAFSAYPVRT